MDYASLEDTCERRTCLGQFSVGHFLPRSIFTTKYEVSIFQCAIECRLRRPRCKSFNYRRSDLTCQLSEEDSGPDGIYLQAKPGRDHSNIDTWRNLPIGHCKEINCSWNERCDPSKSDPQDACVKTECPVAVLKPGVTFQPTNETKIGIKGRYRCVADNLARGYSLTMCLPSTAQWAPTDFKCVCKAPLVKTGTITEAAEVEIGQNYTYRCQDGLIGKRDLNPTVTCLPDGDWTATNFTCVTQNWTLDTVNPNNIHTSEVISNHTGIDLLTCMQECGKEPANCLSLFYDNQTGLCVLSSSFQRAPPNGFNFSGGVVYYTAPSTSCDLPYENVTLAGSYFCIKYHTEAKSFNEAMKACESEKAKLLVVTTKDEITDLANIWRNLDWEVYIGLSDQIEEGHWVSWNGDTVNPAWGTGQPNLGNNEDCASIMWKTDIYNISCDMPITFLCQKKPTTYKTTGTST
ncbi:hypothetical protein ACJMK2_002126 [Sinanodonta woodiana]|uniref:Uncharacterized protein n=1 Tax=Sinanodonta woodiana TaxID=1069815 RepID=A0ABD3XXQ0_SINWO